jgi:hypothetical protein
MPEGTEGSPAALNRTAVECKSDRELVVTRKFNAPAHIVFEAWTLPTQWSTAHTPNSRNSVRVQAVAYNSRIAVTGFRRIARCAGK